MFENVSCALMDAPAPPIAELMSAANRPTRLAPLRSLEGKMLHVGCGTDDRNKLPPMFLHPSWREIRLDIDPNVQPDVIANITDMRLLSDNTIDAVYSSHNIEHLYPHEVPLALREMNRVLNPGGFVLIMLPDLQEVARHVAEGRLESAVFISTMGPVTPLEMIYGHRSSLAGSNPFMAHRTGFTSVTLAAALLAAGFAAALVQRNTETFSLTAFGFRCIPSKADLATAHQQMDAERSAVLYTADMTT